MPIDMMDRLDPELVGPLEGLMEATGGGFSLRDIPSTRAMVDAMLAAVKAEVPPIGGVESEDRSAPSPVGGPDVAVRIYRPNGRPDPLPAVIWLHGGGFVLGGLELDDLMSRQLAKDVECVVVNVDYRLAPEHPYPAALEDARAVLQWAAAAGGEIGIDRDRIAIGGASAGGGIAAGLALMERDRGGSNIAFQLLLYPAINDHNVEQVSEAVPENLFWSRENALTGWRAYLGDRRGGTDVEPYAAPLRAEDLSGLPPAYVGVGAVDMFMDDDLEYGRRLVAAGVPTELHVYPGAFHAFDAFVPMARVSQRFLADRDSALRRAFSS